MNTQLSGNRNAVALEYLSSIFSGEIHARRIESLANGALGVMASASLAVSFIGLALAQARNLNTRHAIKQVDRMLGNIRIVVWDMFSEWVPEPVGQREAIVVAMDWTDFDADDQAALVLGMVTAHGRATPLLWLSVGKDELRDSRNDFEDLCLSRLKAVLPAGTGITILADRGFGDVKLSGFLDGLGFSYCIRIRGNIHVTAADGEKRLASEWVGKGGRARKLAGAGVTAAQYRAGAVVCVHAKDMKDSWCLVTSATEATTREIVNLYAERWTVEPGFRDSKDLRFGMGLSSIRIGNPQKRDRLLLLNAIAIALLTMLGSAGESLGFDRMLKSNTSKLRTHSLFRQGCMLYDLIPNMEDRRLLPLITRFYEIMNQSRTLVAVFGIV